ncbi:putative RNA polymerase II subunit B1 CTD phosphatase RPAP2 homolog [Pistacia vera]|uniref:putative RNA polymerase II subunit B1 CTD phosphatase RPAP2 homolog n=1 Tax=Pistacia vera TaxID=55513 RepID=UPI001263DB0C|nr:putative RNA polymerase II subunit B1 CTD phosphatase RPAP2 homolog [Pistacia vera]
MAKRLNDAVHKLQLSLLDGVSTEHQLYTAGSLLSKSDYNDVVTERTIANLCGYPLCSNPLPPSDSRQHKGRYRISLKEHKVYDLQEVYLFCSTSCLVNSKAFWGGLGEERVRVVDERRIEEVLKVVGAESSVESEMVRRFGELEIREKERGEGVVGEVGAGSSDAIEGFVPKAKYKVKTQLKGEKKEGEDKVKSKSSVEKNKGVNAKTNQQTSKKDTIFSDMNFMSTIIMNDEYSISKVPSGSTGMTSKLKYEDLKTTEGSKNLEAQCATLGSLHSRKEGSDTIMTKSSEKSQIAKNELGVQDVPSTSAPFQSGSRMTSLEQENGYPAEKEPILRAGMPKSSLKSSSSKKLGHSVSWADEKNDSLGSGNLCEFREEMGDGDNDTLRFASAEACAMALSQAAEVVATGDSDAADAVSEAGIIILPRPDDVVGEKQVEDANLLEPKEAPLKWPSKPGIQRSEFFDPEDSWYDTPPEGFSLSLSPFATMWMAIVAWITSSSLAYIYGRDESFHEEYLSVNGREYPRKIVLGDSRSSEIKQTLAACLSRALPGLVADLRLPIPISVIEKEVGLLLETMSFVEALPAFRAKQWQVISLLFIDALSVYRIPTLTPHMTNRTMLLRKVLDGAKITLEEYEVMKDFIIPLGRAPHFSTQSGA